VETQEEDGRTWCAANGFDVAWVIVDNDYSASLWASKERPGYKRVQENLAGADPVDVLVARDSSRMQRDLEVYVQVRTLCARHNVLWAYNGRLYDLSTTGLDALLSERRASETRDDVVKSVNKRVRDGKPHGRVAYGYKPVYDPHTGAPIGRDIDPGPAAIVGRIVAAVLAGESIYSITARLDAESEPAPEAIRRWRRGIEGPSEPWKHRLVKDIAINPTYAALRTHNGKVVPGVEGTWPALISEEDHLEAVALLTVPGRRTTSDVSVKHLLSGIARCGVCGSVCGAIVNRGAPSYGCKGDTRAWRGSRHVVRRQLPVDTLVTANILKWFARPDAAKMYAAVTAAATDEVQAAREDLAELEAKLEAVRASHFRPGGIPFETLERAESYYGPLIAAAQTKLTPRVLPPVIKDGLDAPDLNVWWYGEPGKPETGLSIPHRRLVVRTLVTVTIHKSTAPLGTKGFDPDLIEIGWI
jgi:DNA invertase Pin-like site-specific DNA recombinase